LAADPSTHVDVAESGAGAIPINIQADAGLAFPAVAAASARDVERDGNQVAHIQELYVPAFLNDFAGDLVSQYHTGRSRGAASDHMLIAAADVGAHDLKDHAVLALP